MARDGLIELGARTIFGGRFHSSVLGGQQSSVPAAVEALGPLAAEQALNTARSDRSRLSRRSIRRGRCSRTRRRARGCSCVVPQRASQRAASPRRIGVGSSACATRACKMRIWAISRPLVRCSHLSGARLVQRPTGGRKRFWTAFAEQRTAPAVGLTARRVVCRPRCKPRSCPRLVAPSPRQPLTTLLLDGPHHHGRAAQACDGRTGECSVSGTTT